MVVDASHVAAVGVLAALTIYAAMIDIRSLIIPDTANLAIFGSGLTASVFLSTVDPTSAFLASVLGGASVLAIYLAFRSYRGYDGLGLGDVKFIAAASTWIGVEGLPLALLISSMSALIFVAVQMMFGFTFDRGRPIPFGPFLGMGFLLVAAVQILTGLSFFDAFDAWLF